MQTIFLISLLTPITIMAALIISNWVIYLFTSFISLYFLSEYKLHKDKDFSFLLILSPVPSTVFRQK